MRRLLPRIAADLGSVRLAAAVTAASLALWGAWGARAYLAYAGFTQAQLDALGAAGGLALYRLSAPVAFAVALAAALAAVLARTRLKGLFASVSAFAALGTLFVLVAAASAAGNLLYLGRDDYDAVLRDTLWFDTLWFFTLPIVLSCRLAWKAAGLRLADRGLANGLLWAALAHFVALMVIPLCFRCFHSMDAYEIPKGDGAVQAVVKIQRPKPKKPKPKFVLNPNSPIIFRRPELDDTRMKELEELTANEYQATTMGPPTKKRNARPGWPNGIENAKIRFIRLKYAGGDWDQDMGKGSDYNMLLWIKEHVGLKIADETEAISVGDLKFWRRGKKPPFVYLTGRGAIGLNQGEIKTLRKYLLEEGGMLFADNGGGSFHSAFVSLMRRAVPELELVDIATDDEIFQQPFLFPNGAPPLWHHSGSRALGMKHNGRWIVFYHQGDINDAWKTGGSGASEDIRERAFKLGANVISYAFTQYLAQTLGE